MTKKKKQTNNNPITLLRVTIDTFFHYPIIFYPFIISAFIQLLVVEIIYFSVRFPLSKFFGPIIKWKWGEAALHYPYFMMVIPNIFSGIQMFLYTFVGAFLIAVSIKILVKINENSNVVFGRILRQTFSQYVHVTLAMMLFYAVYLGLNAMYDLILQRGLQIRSETGIYGLIKHLVVGGAPHFYLFIAVFITFIFGYVIPIIIIEQKKVFSAILLNFKVLTKSFWITFSVVFLAMVFYLPVHFIQSNVAGVFTNLLNQPEIHFFVFITGILIMIFVDALIYISLSSYYLLSKE